MAAEESGAGVIVRRAIWRDLRPVRESYQAQTPDSRELYHPFPFSTVRLSLLLAGMWGIGHASRRWVRIFPRTTAVLFVARGASDGGLAGFGTVRFRRDEAGRLVGRTGLYVLPGRRRAGVGRSIKQALLDHARALGATRAEAFLLEVNRASAELNRQMGFQLRPAGAADPSEAGGHVIAETDLEPAPG
ncbi:MAG: GNAT family N-acetyltransferase [Thermoplasmata archaeon]|nr:GNAT family N-acetyltransferase [Thermoplasmata archaeon]